jgi:hypothetical protein
MVLTAAAARAPMLILDAGFAADIAGLDRGRFHRHLQWSTTASCSKKSWLSQQSHKALH